MLACHQRRIGLARTLGGFLEVGDEVEQLDRLEGERAHRLCALEARLNDKHFHFVDRLVHFQHGADRVLLQLRVAFDLNEHPLSVLEVADAKVTRGGPVAHEVGRAAHVRVDLLEGVEQRHLDPELVVGLKLGQQRIDVEVDRIHHLLIADNFEPVDRRLLQEPLGRVAAGGQALRRDVVSEGALRGRGAARVAPGGCVDAAGADQPAVGAGGRQPRVAGAHGCSPAITLSHSATNSA